jgi:uncharacterized protein YlbG (UPF0298 family)
MDVTFVNKDERYFNVYFNSAKAIDAANVRFPKMLNLIDDKFGVIVSKKSIFPITLWCNENELIIENNLNKC